MRRILVAAGLSLALSGYAYAEPVKIGVITTLSGGGAGLGIDTRDAFTLAVPHAPFIQFTYAVVPPIPKSLAGVRAEPSERIWMNLPPARVWVYRKH